MDRALQYGDHNVQNNFFGVVPARSAYRLQVQRIAPESLRGRESELAELRAFCAAPRGPAWTWWRAPPWAGKSALMSTFALGDWPGLRVVPFFVTARFGGQHDRIGFTDAVMNQLAALLREPGPGEVTDSTREIVFLDLLTRAAAAARQGNERLILLVDGLDEDQGFTTSHHAHSIAALLPAEPPHGMRIIVTSRPHPPVPGDVPAGHPLHDPGIIRDLSPSPDADVVRMDMEREIKRLLQGEPAQRDLVGLIAAAGGGLSAADLAVLMDASVREVADQLATVTGRSFSAR
ncbi:hypothetical protein AB0M02_36395 [Actinoplanes sp. NPDC051861]|uniref:hypothetical protein n=1 Tax=Actinoplanes sp. NPDC051861 TaxID=3155170 RepID=UPI003415EB86